MGVNALLANKTAGINFFFFPPSKIPHYISNLTASVLLTWFFKHFVMGHHCGGRIIKWTKDWIHQCKGAEAEKAAQEKCFANRRADRAPAQAEDRSAPRQVVPQLEQFTDHCISRGEVCAGSLHHIHSHY